MKIWWILITKYDGIPKPRQTSVRRLLGTLGISSMATWSVSAFFYRLSDGQCLIEESWTLSLWDEFQLATSRPSHRFHSLFCPFAFYFLLLLTALGNSLFHSIISRIMDAWRWCSREWQRCENCWITRALPYPSWMVVQSRAWCTGGASYRAQCPLVHEQMRSSVFW